MFGYGGINVYNQGGLMGSPAQNMGYGTQDMGFGPTKWNPLGMQAPVMHGPGARRKLNPVSIVLSFAIPFALFVATFYLMAFSMHYMHPTPTYALEVALLGVALAFGGAAVDAMKKKNAGLPVEPSWFLFLFATCLFAWSAGLLLGEYTYVEHMQKYFDRRNLRTVVDVVPGEKQGQELMDAGQIYFKKGTRVDQNLTYAYTRVDRYCVAPVVPVDTPKLASYDFWAVGKNCCFGKNDFQCGGNMWDEKVHAGLRWWGDDEQQMFSMAVGQAQAAYGIRAMHPIFLTWMENPTARVNHHLRKAWDTTIGCCISFGLFQAFLVGLATFSYARLHTKRGHAHLYQHM